MSGEPNTVEDLAAEEVDGWDHLLGPLMRGAMKEMLADVYATHPVMKQLADERLGDREAPSYSDERALGAVGVQLRAEYERKISGG